MIESSFWKSSASQIFLNPRLPQELQGQIAKAIIALNKTSAIWIKSSGTESGSHGHKMVCIQKSSFLVAAKSVNQFFQIQDNDVYLNPLPVFHVGGLSISARCYLSGAREVAFVGWDPKRFTEALENDSVTITSLVPTQIFDLMAAGLRPPQSLRVVLVGGGALTENIYTKARALGWPLYPGYGMTETSALVASASYPYKMDSDPFEFEVLGHAKFRKVDDSTVLSSESLFEGYCLLDKSGEPTWVPRPVPFILDDRLEIIQNRVRVLGRSNDFVKILGESVSLVELEDKLSALLNCSVAVVATPHDRKGYDLHLFVTKKGWDLEQVNTKVMPYERFSQLHVLTTLPRTSLGKVNKSELKSLIQQANG